MRHLALRPALSSYAFTDGRSTSRIDLGGSVGRYRRDFVGSSYRVTCAWILSGDEYTYMRAFYNTASAEGSLPFTVDLILDKAVSDCCCVERYTSYFIPETMRLNSKSGDIYYVSAELEVKPEKPADDCETLANFELKLALGANAQTMINEINEAISEL
jgi:hypothetical protein